jgi:hypothetical protein
MLLRALLLASALVFSLPSHAKVPVPPEKAAYVGEWHGAGISLRLEQDGKVEYKKARKGENINLSVELQGFNGDNFEAGVLFVHSTFVVSKPPHLDNGKWKMTVDGVELTKVESTQR